MPTYGIIGAFICNNSTLMTNRLRHKYSIYPYNVHPTFDSHSQSFAQKTLYRPTTPRFNVSNFMLDCTLKTWCTVTRLVIFNILWKRGENILFVKSLDLRNYSLQVYQFCEEISPHFPTTVQEVFVVDKKSASINCFCLLSRNYFQFQSF